MLLVLNCGSQSVKWKIFGKGLEILYEGQKEYFNYSSAEKVLKKELKEIKKISSQIEIVGHRIVHGGRFFEPVLINKKILKEIERVSLLAPLHNPFQLLGIRVSQKIFRKAKQIAVFDTQFFKDLPEISQIYPLPEKIRKKFFIRKFGFHGISHKYLAEKASEILKRPLKKINLITLHLGGGASITAIEKGKPIETSMGFTPLEGLLMASRSGDIDPGLVLFLGKNLGLKKTEEILIKESGIKSLAKTSNFKELLKRKDKFSKLAFDLFVYRIRKYLAFYYFSLLKAKVEAIVFSGSVGARSLKTREAILKDFPLKKETKILALETNEALQMAKEIFSFLKLKI